MTPTQAEEAVEAVVDDRATEDYGIAEHLAVIQTAYAEAVAAIAALAESWQQPATELEGDDHGDEDRDGDGDAENDGPVTVTLHAVPERPRIPSPRAA
jgi:hypothetical protein